MRRRNIAITALACTVAAPIVWLASYFVPRTIHEPPMVVSGPNSFSQRITWQRSYTEWGIFPGPEGFYRKKSDMHDGFFIEAPGTPRTELSFLQGTRLAFRWYSLPNSSQWVVVSTTSQTNLDGTVRFIVTRLDTKQILRQHEISVRELPGERDVVNLENGNRLVVYRSASGFEVYDVLNDTVSGRP